MADRIPIFADDVSAWSLPAVRWSWLWVHCVSPFCGHAQAMALMPWRLRWDADNPCDAMRRHFRCAVCGRKGCTFVCPAVDSAGIEPFPEGAAAVRMAGERRAGESFDTRDARVRAEYLARFHSD